MSLLSSEHHENTLIYTVTHAIMTSVREAKLEKESQCRNNARLPKSSKKQARRPLPSHAARLCFFLLHFYLFRSVVMCERLVALQILAPLKEPVEALQRERDDQRGGAANDEDDAAVLQRRERELLEDDVHLGRGGGAGRHAHVGLRDLRGEG